jgi:hypothetical protein
LDPIMEPFLPTSRAQDEYTGPEELRAFADVLPFIGELAISFSGLERRVTWAIESLLYKRRARAAKLTWCSTHFAASQWLPYSAAWKRLGARLTQVKRSCLEDSLTGLFC